MTYTDSSGITHAVGAVEASVVDYLRKIHENAVDNARKSLNNLGDALGVSNAKLADAMKAQEIATHFLLCDEGTRLVARELNAAPAPVTCLKCLAIGS